MGERAQRRRGDQGGGEEGEREREELQGRHARNLPAKADARPQLVPAPLAALGSSAWAVGLTP